MTDVSKIAFTSDVFPSGEDMKLWHSLSPEEQEAYIVHAEEEGFQSGPAPDESLSQRLARVRS